MAAAYSEPEDALPVVILIVEDEALVRLDMADTLRDQPGVTVIEAATADAAWEHLLDNGAVDLVFTDHRMPGRMTGGQLAAKVAAEFPAMQVVVTSAYCEDSPWKGPVLGKPYDQVRVAAELVRLARQVARRA